MKYGLSEPGFRDFKGCKDRLEVVVIFFLRNPSLHPLKSLNPGSDNLYVIIFMETVSIPHL
jgi:hypothetical protein